jgi:hypothetical protein
MSLPEGLAALVSALEQRGFTVVTECWKPWPGGSTVELSAPQGPAAKGVRLSEDRGFWEVEVRISRGMNGWFEPFMALLALENRPHQQRALSHEERRKSTLEFIDRFTGESRQVRTIRNRRREIIKAYNRRLQGKTA